MRGVKDESEACWSECGLLHQTENKVVIKERALRAMVSNFILNSATKAGIDELNLY